MLGTDFSQWTYWWRANRDRFVRVKDVVRRSRSTVYGSDDFFMGPSRRVLSMDVMALTDADIMERILPALNRLLDSTDQRDITELGVMALGKIGRDHPKFGVRGVIRARLKSPVLGVRQTAALALGITQMPEALDTLQHLVLDDQVGRATTGQPFVGDYTRSFAAYGMALIAWAGDAAAKRRTLDVMKRVLRSESIADRNIRVAAVVALGLLNPGKSDPNDKNSVCNLALSELDRFYAQKLGRGLQILQSHVPTSVAKLIGRGDTARHVAYKDLFRRQLLGTRKYGEQIHRAAAIALGQLALAPEVDKTDEPYSAALRHYFENGKDQQARYLCLMSLGQIGGNANRTQLLTVLARGKKVLERPWAALALGVYCHRAAGADPHPDKPIDKTVGRELVAQFKAVKAPEARSAFAIALGLVRYRDAAPQLLATLKKEKHQDGLAGYVCMGLALMGHEKARPVIQEVCKQAIRRPSLLKRAAVALGKLGDRRVAKELTEMLRGESSNLASLGALALALGHIGDRRSVAPLAELISDSTNSNLSRAFGAAALGGIADKELLPWNAKIGANSNYRGAVETLADIL